MKWFLAITGLVILKSLLWINLIPIFQTPDEQAHFAQLSYIAENKTLSINSEKNLSLEIASAEETLGTRRDELGNNKYTYHPEYKNNSPINKLPISSRTTYVGKEAAMYPPLYYLSVVPAYLVTYSGSIVDRILAVRLFGIIFGLGLAMVAFKIGKLIWEDELMSICFSGIVSFQPMISFVGSGIHPDNLVNLISSVIILICLLILKNGLRLKYFVLIGVLAIAGLLTKQTIVFVYPVVGAVVLFGAHKKLWPASLAVLLSPVLAFWQRWPLPYMPATGESPGLFDYFKFRLPKTLFETWPWFWGVFKWLGVTLPKIPMQIITRVAGLSLLGVAIRLFKKRDFEFKAIIFFLISCISFLLYMFLWDWRLMQSMGFSQGLQGRYLFPIIIPIMGIIMSGFVSYFGKLKKHGAIVMLLAMVLLNGYSLWLISSLY